MKTATLPALRVEPELRKRIESVLDQGETLSSFMESTLRSAVEFRAMRNAFHARGMRSKEHFDATGISYSTEEVVERLRGRTQRRREQMLGALEGIESDAGRVPPPQPSPRGGGRKTG